MYLGEVKILYMQVMIQDTALQSFLFAKSAANHLLDTTVGPQSGCLLSPLTLEPPCVYTVVVDFTAF